MFNGYCEGEIRMIKRINPDSMHSNPAFSQVAVVDASAKLVFVGGQNGVGKDGKVVGKDIASQSEQATKNVLTCLEAAGATMADMFKMTIYVVQGQSLEDAFGAAVKVMPRDAPPSTVMMCFVAALANPDYLIEIEAVAAIGGQ
jgi:enamine deaminase RidA (YjgF/YER057c/UK114 family)